MGKEALVFMVCKECKKRIKKDTAVCPYCGTPQTEMVSLGAMHDAGRKKKKQPLPRWRKILAPILFVLLIASLAALPAGSRTVHAAAGGVFVSGLLQHLIAHRKAL